MLRQLSLLITSSHGILLWCGATVLFALLAYLRLRAKARPVRSGLSRLVERISGLRGPEGFSAGYQAFHEDLSEDPLLGHQWREFAETLVLPSPRGRRQVISNSVDGATFFNLGTVVGGRINLRFYKEVSNYLPGLGILGTFVGLTAGIYLAHEGLATNDTDKMRLALGQLLNGASLAFWTSIAGLVCSLIYSYAEKRTVHQLEVLINRWCEALDMRLEKVTLEQLAGQQLSELRDHTLQLERFNTDLAVSISTALDERLELRFSPLLERTLGVLEGLRQDQKKADEEFIRKVAEEFRTTFAGAAGTEMTAMATTMQELTSNLHQVASSLSGAGSRVGDDFMAAAGLASEQLRHTMAQMTGVFDERQRASEEAFQRSIHGLSDEIAKAVSEFRSAAKDAGAGMTVAATAMEASAGKASSMLEHAGLGMIEGLAKSWGSLTGTVDRLAGVVGEMERASGAASKSLQQSKENLDRLWEVHAALGRVVAPLSSVGEGMAESIAALRDLLQQFDAMEGRMRIITDTLAQSGEALGTSWQNVHERFQSIDTALAKSFTEINSGVAAHADGIRTFVTELDESLTRATGLLSGAIEQLRESVEELGDKQ